jgi:sugar/nucleoside kinase (ribokinase family)
LRHTDLFFPNEDEAIKIAARPNAAAAAHELATLAHAVVVKRGSQGAYIATDKTGFEVSAIPTQVVDTTGAGDSFNAGFLAEFLKGGSLDACAHAGVLAGARNVEKVGGTAAFEKYEA